MLVGAQCKIHVDPNTADLVQRRALESQTTAVIVGFLFARWAMTDTFPLMLERVLQESQRQLYSELLVLLEHSERDGLGKGRSGSPTPEPSQAHSLGSQLRSSARQRDASSSDFSGAAGAAGIVPHTSLSNDPSVVPEQTVSGRRSLTYDLARRASAPSEAEAQKVKSQKSVSLTDVLTNEGGKPQGFVGKIVNSWQFETCFAVVILTNSIFIGVVLQWESENKFTSVPTAIYAISLAYGVLFTVELLLRMIAAGLSEFYCQKNWAWNLFDTLVVASVIYEFIWDYIWDASGSQSTSMSSNLRILRVVRLTRLTRIVRVLRIARFVRPLRTLVQSILGTLKALIWAMLLMTLINYVFSAIFVDIVSNYLADSPDVEVVESLRSYFGTLQSSSLTLFMSISGGLSWFEATQPLKKISWLWVYVFCIHVAFCLFALLNAVA